jgi:hypothetical protein
MDAPLFAVTPPHLRRPKSLRTFLPICRMSAKLIGQSSSIATLAATSAEIADVPHLHRIEQPPPLFFLAKNRHQNHIVLLLNL